MYCQEYTIILDFEIEKIFSLMQDLEIYKKILPYIKTFDILKKEENKEECKIQYDAYVELSHMFVKLNYNCEIIFDLRDYKIDIYGFGGSFEYINAFWKLEKYIGSQTKISYRIEFELKCKWQQKFAKKIFEFNAERIRKKLINSLNEMKHQI